MHIDLFYYTDKAYDGSRWCVVFTDDYSRRHFVGFYEDKDDLFIRFQEFYALMDSSFGKLGKVRLDNELPSYGRFQRFCGNKGIAIEASAPYMHQQNGVAERANAIILTVARCLRIDAHLLDKLWSECVRAAVYIIDQLPKLLIGGRSAFKA